MTEHEMVKTDEELIRECVENALEAIPKTRKAAYLRAVEEAPAVVKSESDPVWFWRLCDLDCLAAAARMTDYWDYRLATFGTERAFLPMKATGDGALGDAVIALLRTGFLAPVPPDAAGRQVVLQDGTRWSSSSCTSSDADADTDTAGEQKADPCGFVVVDDPSSMSEAWKALFYILQVTAHQRENAQTDGVVWLNIIRGTPSELDRVTAAYRHFSDLYEKNMPLRLHAYHLVCLPPEGADVREFDGTLARAMDRSLTNFLKPLTRTTTIYRHDRDDSKPPPAKRVKLQGSTSASHTNGTDCAAQLVTYGFTKEGLPEMLGGTWNYSRFDEWLRNRIHAERALQTHLLSHSSDSAGDSSDERDDPDSLRKLEKSVAAVLDFCQEETVARQCRRRDLDREIFVGLQNKCLDTIQKNIDLENDNRQMEEMFARALLEMALELRVKIGMDLGEVSPGRMRAMATAAAAANDEVAVGYSVAGVAAIGDAFPLADMSRRQRETLRLICELLSDLLVEWLRTLREEINPITERKQAVRRELWSHVRNISPQ